jgi:hypothetical protein
MQEIKGTEGSKAMHSEDFNKEAGKGNLSSTGKMDGTTENHKVCPGNTTHQMHPSG